MNKYIIGTNIIGYDNLKLEENLDNIAESVVVIILDGKTIDIPLYYIQIKKLLSKNKVILITTEKNEQFSILAALMASVNRYDIYCVTDRDIITAGYLEVIEGRSPDYLEIQQYIGADITAYDRVTEIIMHIANMIDDGDLDKLKKYIEDNKESIDSIVMAIDTMKKYADLTNGKELISEVETLKEEVSNLNEAIVEYKKEKETAMDSSKLLQQQLDETYAEKQALMNKIEMMEDQLQSGTPVINYYSEVNMTYIKHKIQRVLYFKEISEVLHTMSLINSIYELLTNSRKMNIKFVMYDSSTEIYEPYIDNNIKIINSKNYAINKPMLVGKPPCLISEPNPAITNDLLTVPDGYDVLIIYDKMHRYENILSGNNVTRIVVTSSSKELESTRKKLMLDVGDMILTTPNSDIHRREDLINKDNIISIEEINGYNQLTQSAKVARYVKMVCPDGSRITEKIFKVSNISAMF